MWPSVTGLGNFQKFSVTNFPQKVAQTFGTILENITFGYFFGNVSNNFGYPLSQHLVTLHVFVVVVVWNWPKLWILFLNCQFSYLLVINLQPVWPDLAIFRTLGNFLKPLATINFAKSPTFLGNFCKGVKIYHFFSEIIFGQLL